MCLNDWKSRREKAKHDKFVKFVSSHVCPFFRLFLRSRPRRKKNSSTLYFTLSNSIHFNSTQFNSDEKEHVPKRAHSAEFEYLIYNWVNGILVPHSLSVCVFSIHLFSTLTLCWQNAPRRFIWHVFFWAWCAMEERTVHTRTCIHIQRWNVQMKRKLWHQIELLSTDEMSHTCMYGVCVHAWDKKQCCARMCSSGWVRVMKIDAFQWASWGYELPCFQA